MIDVVNFLKEELWSLLATFEETSDKGALAALNESVEMSKLCLPTTPKGTDDR